VLKRVARRVLGSAAAAVDRAATLAVQARNAQRTASVPPLGLHQRVEKLSAIAELYPKTLGDDFFLPLRAIAPMAREAQNEFSAARVVDVSWPSAYEPFLSDVGERYARTAENHAAAARLFLGNEPRPVAVVIHGYMAGQFNVEQRLWPIERFLRSGYDVALFVLPFHGVRADPARRGAPEFPGADPRVTNEGFRQAIADLRNFVQWLKQSGHPQVGVLGMSLGGYTAALLATIETELAFCVPVIPLASLADFAREQGELNPAPATEAQEHALLEQIYRVVSPLDRASRIAPNRTLVVGAKADRITPVVHARRLAVHFGSPLISWHGGHLLQLGRDACFRRVETLLRELRATPLHV